MTRERLLGLAGVALFLASTGCSQQPQDPERIAQSYIYFFDGAGGGGTLWNWAGGLREGLLEAGYKGDGEIFPWNTGLGILADQKASVEYKRQKASQCAQRIRDYTSRYPEAPVVLIGFSAGAAVAVFTLEELPPSCSVEDVVLCSASISADYDLTRALQHVRHRLYVLTSEKDAVLSVLVPIAGTADRKRGHIPPAGLRGFRLPPDRAPETLAQYAKIVEIPWREEFERDGDFGGHMDVLNKRFVQQMTRMIMPAPSPGVAVPHRARALDPDGWSQMEPMSNPDGHPIVN